MTSITKLRELLAAATPGPWEMDECQKGLMIYCGMQNDALLIVAMRNCLPELLAVVEASKHVYESSGVCMEISEMTNDFEDLRQALAALEKRLETV